MSYTSRIDWEPLRSIDSATFMGVFQPIGTPLSFPSIRLKLVNNSDVLVTISINGTTPIDVAPANSFWLYDADMNPYRNRYPENTQFYVNGSAGTGFVYLVSQYLVLI